jgi:hypothetical protein
MSREEVWAKLDELQANWGSFDHSPDAFIRFATRECNITRIEAKQAYREWLTCRIIACQMQEKIEREFLNKGSTIIAWLTQRLEQEFNHIGDLHFGPMSQVILNWAGRVRPYQSRERDL